MNKGLTFTGMMRAALTASAIIATAGAATAQIRVDAPIHSSYGSCPSCDLSNKRLNGMKLENANFAGSIFNHSNLSGGQFNGADLTGAHFRKALLYGFQADAVKMAGAVLEDATLTQSSITNSILQNVDLRRANMTRANFSKNDFRAANLTDAKAVNVNFSGSNFEDAKLDNSNLQDANLSNGVFKSASFGKAILLGSYMQDADLSGANLSGVQGLSQVQLDTACGNAETKLPDGLFLPFCTESRIDPVEAPLLSTLTQGAYSQDTQSQDMAQDTAITEITGNPLQGIPVLGFDQKP